MLYSQMGHWQIVSVVMYQVNFRIFFFCMMYLDLLCV